MKFALLLLASIVVAAPPVSDEDIVEKLIVTEKFFPETFVTYTGKYDIVDIVVPLNHINYDDTSKETDGDLLTFFFVEAEIKNDGSKDYKGLYVYKHNKAKLVLENGQCSTYAKNAIAYFGAKDGIYKYNNEDVTTTKYGTVTESVIKMAVDPERAFVYYLTEDYVLYRYNEDEVESTKVDVIKDARDIAFDFDGNMFFYNGKNEFYSYNGDKVTKIEGLPTNPTKVELVRVPVVINYPFAVINGRLYAIHLDGTIEKTPVEFQVQPTAYAPETVLIEYYAYQKKIYKYNFITLFEDKSIDELSTFFEDKEDQIKSIKTTKLTNQL